MDISEKERSMLLEALDLLRRDTRREYEAVGSANMSNRSAELAYNALGRQLEDLAALSVKLRGGR